MPDAAIFIPAASPPPWTLTMRAHIGPDLLRKLPTKHVDIRDDSVRGFMLRVRPSGTHTYRAELGRGIYRTIGRVGDISPEAARLAAQTLLAAIGKNTLDLMAKDETLTHAKARAKARAAFHAQHGKMTWGEFLEKHYGPWVTANRKTGAESPEHNSTQRACGVAAPGYRSGRLRVSWHRWRSAR
jgi:hypothetical protein